MFENVPHLNWLANPEEMERARHVSSQLGLLAMYARQFKDAVELFDHLHGAWTIDKQLTPKMNRRAQLSRWMQISARDAVLTTYHYRSALFSIRENLKYCQELSSKVDLSTLDNAIDEFKTVFPEITNFRHAVAHEADMMFKPSDVAKHKPKDAPFIVGNLSGRTIMSAWEGKQYSLAVTHETAASLVRIMNHAYRAFAGATW
jgi:hypothetical protein